MWVQTVSGRKVDLLDPSPSQIDIQDIATALSRIARFNGHTVFPYSVAQHCALGAGWARRCGFRVADELALRFLLHDAHEAYLGDIATPVAQAVCDATSLRLAKKRLDAAIWLALVGAPPPGLDALAAATRELDLAMLRTERDQLMTRPPEPWDAETEATQALPISITPVSPETARDVWLTTFYALLAIRLS